MPLPRGSSSPSRRSDLDRCMFASNFPVDAMQGTFNDLYGVFSNLTRGLDDASVDKLFAGTAERVYRLG